MRIKKILSIVIPTFNEEDNIKYAYREIIKVLKTIPKYDYEIIFVDNYSTDQSRNIIKSLAKKDKKITAIFLSRNFTSEYSSHAAMKQAVGDILTIIDCDLQDDPKIIKKFIKEWENGYLIVVGVRNIINDTFIMKFIRKLFYVIFKKMSNIEMPLNAGTFCLIDRKALDVIIKLPERNRFFRGLRAWAGFKTAYVEYERAERKYGKTRNTIFDYIRDAQRGLLGFSFIPLDIMSTFGFLLTFLSFVLAICYLLWVLIIGNPINASIPIMLSIFVFGGIQMLGISMVGKYIQIVFEEVKNRPQYVIEKIINNHRKK
jgi:polyisoprenyl-phosphate glycosyltransferase